MSNYIERANVLIEQRRYQLAEEELYKALADSPDSATAQHLLAFCLYNQQRYTEALPVISAAIALQPDGAGHHFYHGQILRRLNRSQEAAAANIITLRLNPQDPDAHAQAAAITMYDQQNYAAAIEHADRALQLDATHAWSLELRMLALYELDQLAAVASAAQEALAVLPNYADFHTITGMVAARRQQVPEALAAFREAMRLQPENAWATQRFLNALQAMAEQAMAQNRVEDAADHYREARRLEPDCDWARIGLIAALKARPFSAQSRQARSGQSRRRTGLLALLCAIPPNFRAPIATCFLAQDPEGQRLLSADEIISDQFRISLYGAMVLGLGLFMCTRQIAWGLLPLVIGSVVFSISLWRIRRRRPRLIQWAGSASWLVFATTAAMLCVFVSGAVSGDFKGSVILIIALPMVLPILALLVLLGEQVWKTITAARQQPIATSASQLIALLRNPKISNALIAAAGVALTLMTYQAGWIFLIPAPGILVYGGRQFRRMCWDGWLQGAAAMVLGLGVLSLGGGFILPLQTDGQYFLVGLFVILGMLSGAILALRMALKGAVLLSKMFAK